MPKAGGYQSAPRPLVACAVPPDTAAGNPDARSAGDCDGNRDSNDGSHPLRSRKQLSHICQLEALGCTVTLEPAA
jgi:hypothetical protein